MSLSLSIYIYIYIYNVYMCICVCVYMYVYIYIYIYINGHPGNWRVGSRSSEAEGSAETLSSWICVCIHIYIYIDVYLGPKNFRVRHALARACRSPRTGSPVP